MRIRHFFAASAAVAAAIACGSFSEGTPPDTNDAATPDGSITDATPSVDGPTDDAAAPLRKCVGMEHLTEGFETVPPGGWSISPGGIFQAAMIGLPPPSLFTETPVLVVDARTDNTLKRTFGLSGHTRVCIELDVWLEVGPEPFTGQSFAELLDVHPNTGAAFYIELRPEAFSLVQGTSPVAISPFTKGAWQHLVLRIPFGSTTRPTITVDEGTPASAPSPANEVPDSVDVDLGLQARGRDGGGPAVRLHVDNFHVTSEP